MIKMKEMQRMSWVTVCLICGWSLQAEAAEPPQGTPRFVDVGYPTQIVPIKRNSDDTNQNRECKGDRS